MSPKDLPDYLKQGDHARLFPVLAVTSKEGRTASIFLACLACIEELASNLLGTVGRSVGKRARVEAFTEVILQNMPDSRVDRPDGLIVVRIGNTEWRALVEAKVGAVELTEAQVEKYREIAKHNGLDCVITISNQFTSSAKLHPIDGVRRSRSKIPVYHWSWMYVLTVVDLLLSNDSIADTDQRTLLNELRRFLSHESAGVKGFDRMPPEWTALNRLVSNAGTISVKSAEAASVVDAWHQETKDLSLILSRLTQAQVNERLPRRHRADPALRQKDALTRLKDEFALKAAYDIPDTVGPLDVTADLKGRSIIVSMFLRAPEDKKSSKARLNWLLRQIRDEDAADLWVGLNWPGRSEATQFPVSELRENPGIVEIGKEHLQVVSFDVFLARRLGARFTQVSNFITDLEAIVPEYYRRVGSDLSAWIKRAPQIRDDATPADVSVDAISTESETFD